jgi:hypothetical protein
VNEVLGGISRVTFQMGVSTLPHQKVLHAIEILGSVVSAIVMNAGDRACPETSPPVLTPVPAVGNQLELLLEKRMVRMCYSQTSNLNIAMRRS